MSNSRRTTFTDVFRTLLANEMKNEKSTTQQAVNLRPCLGRRDLEIALDEGQFLVYYQPKVSAVNRRLDGAEALLRWRHPQLGLLRPSAFIGIAEETGFIHELGAWVLRRVGDLHSQLQTDPAQPGCRLSVNISPVQFSNPAYIKAFLKAAHAVGLPMHLIEFEITETSVMNDLRQAAQLMQLIRSYGIAIALDDFGVGFNSMRSLAYLPVSTVKIDMSFVQPVCTSPLHRKLVDSMLSMCRALDLTSVAEGVENEAQATMMQELDCEFLQGYLFGEPMVEHKFLELWATR